MTARDAGTCNDTAGDAEVFDIRQLSLERQGSALRVTWTMSTTVNLGSGTVGFALNLSSKDGRHRGQAVVTFANGRQSNFSTLSFAGAKVKELDRKADVTGNSVSASFPMDHLTEYGFPFRYSGATTLDGEVVDACPDADKTTGDIAYRLFTGK